MKSDKADTKVGFNNQIFHIENDSAIFFSAKCELL